MVPFETIQDNGVFLNPQFSSKKEIAKHSSYELRGVRKIRIFDV